MKFRFGITGATGSLGKNLIKVLPKKNFNIYNGDIRSKVNVEKWIKNHKFETVIHLAAVVPIKTVNQNKKKAFDVNFKGTKYLVDVLVNSDVKWFFFASTSHVYKSSRNKIAENSLKQPISYYGKTKLLAENYIIKKFKYSNKKFCIGRIFSTSNIKQKKNYLVPDLINKTKKTKSYLTLKNLNHYRDFISMVEISKIILSLYKKKFCGIINIGRGEGILLKDIAKLICEKFKKKYKIVDNKKITYLVANNKKLKKYFRFNKKTNLEKLIF